MIKKITAMVMLIIFVSLNVSCVSSYIAKVHMQEGKTLRSGNHNILTIYTKSRQLITFLKKSPAAVIDGNIVGLTMDEAGNKKLISIPVSEAEVLWVEKINIGGTLINTLAGLGVFGWYYFVIKGSFSYH